MGTTMPSVRRRDERRSSTSRYRAHRRHRTGIDCVLRSRQRSSVRDPADRWSSGCPTLRCIALLGDGISMNAEPLRTSWPPARAALYILSRVTPIGESCPRSSREICAGAVFWGAISMRPFSRCRPHRCHHQPCRVRRRPPSTGWIDRVEIDGVDATEYVNERDPWYPLRRCSGPRRQTACAKAWSALETSGGRRSVWRGASPNRHFMVGGTQVVVRAELRHLVFAMESGRRSRSSVEPFDPIGLPNSGSVDFPWPGLDRAFFSAVCDVLAVNDGRAVGFSGLPRIGERGRLRRQVDGWENGPYLVLERCNRV